jgi:hypothetical protein
VKVVQEFERGDAVEWNAPQGKTRGKVKKKLTSNWVRIKVKASEDDPRYFVQSVKTHPPGRSRCSWPPWRW